MSTLFVSDVHLSPDAPERTERFSAFLRDRAAGHDLVIAGDLFDWWYGLPGLVPADVAAIVDLFAATRSTLWMEGNHDVMIGRAFDAASSVAHVDRPLGLELGGRTLHVAHGDEVDPQAVAYLRFRRLLRGPAGRLAAAVFGSRVTRAVGSFAARRSRHLQGGVDGYDGLSADWLAAARGYAARSGAEITVLGHGHWLGWWADGLICLGDWFAHDSYLRLDGDGTLALMGYRPDGDVVLRSGPDGPVSRG